MYCVWRTISGRKNVLTRPQLLVLAVATARWMRFNTLSIFGSWLPPIRVSARVQRRTRYKKGEMYHTMRYNCGSSGQLCHVSPPLEGGPSATLAFSGLAHGDVRRRTEQSGIHTHSAARNVEKRQRTGHVTNRKRCIDGGRGHADDKSWSRSFVLFRERAKRNTPRY